MRFLLFGTGDYYNRYKKWFASHEIVALLDNSVEKQHTIMDGVEILSPQEGIKLKYDKIVILSFYVTEMKQQLMLLGVKESCICHFYNLHQILTWKEHVRPTQYYLNAKEITETDKVKAPKILLLSNELTLGGPPIALFHAAKVLKKQGYEIVYASMIDGPLKDILLQENIPVIIDENLQMAVMEEIKWVKAFSLIFCNTLNFHVFLSRRDTAIPVIWWLHDARFFYDGVDREVIGKISLRNLNAVSVGPIPAMAIHEFLPELNCGELLYGVNEKKGSAGKKEDKIIRFITIGFLEDIKGQDILLKAIKNLTNTDRQKCEFYLVGHKDTLFGQRLQRESADSKEIIFTGCVDRQKIHEIYDSSDVLICPSRQDSMPTVAAEAMMHGVPCLISDAVGTAAYLQDGVNGLTFQSENAEELSQKITWCITHSQELPKMGVCARKVYDLYFSIKVFEEKLLGMVERSL